MTRDISSTTFSEGDFSRDNQALFGKERRWRMVGMAMMATSAALSTTLYWKIGVFLISAA
ncbi:hypothetical protein GOB57_25110 [Sinorhizobium meliloti]|nr:hypothetical protein [Sinorhizobium meliloti]